MISAKIITYAHKKVMNDREQPRGYEAPVSSDIADLIKHAASGWKPPILKKPEVDWEPVVHCDGVILSGPELVNCEWRREELLERYPKAIAIEMEGEGIFAAATDLKMEWVVIKGVSDYADGNKSKTEEWQPVASVMAASVVANMLKFPGVLKDWEHYRGLKHPPSGSSSALGMAGKVNAVLTGAVIVLLIGIAIMYFFFTSPQGNIKNLGIPKDDVIDTNPKGTPPEDPLTTLLQSITGGPPGQVNYKGRTISYRAQGRIHSLDEPWVYDGTAWDIQSGIKAKVKHYEQSGDAVKDAVVEVIKKLKEQGIIKD